MLWFINKISKITIAELAEQFLKASVNRWKHGYRRQSTFDRYEYTMRLFREYCGDTQANWIKRQQVLSWRNNLAVVRNLNKPDRPKTRRYVNNQLLCVRELFRWGERQGIITEEALQTVLSVPVIQKGDTDLLESSIVTSVSLELVEKTLQYTRHFIADMVRVHYLTGMRSGELCSIRPCDLSEEGPLLRYIPESHKTDYLGKGRIIYIGPKAQNIIKTYVEQCQSPNEYLWSPSKTLSEMWSNCKNPHPEKWRGGDRYFTPVYYGHIYRAQKRAGVERWHPHQLRHLFATLAAKEFDSDSIKESLGHSSVKMTQIYIDPSFDKAEIIAERLG